MGMYDSFYFENGILPDNKAPDMHEFQTKDLDSSLDTYHVDKDGNVKKFEFDSSSDKGLVENKRPINADIVVYSHEFLYDSDDIFTRKYLGCKYQEYNIVIVNSKITHTEKTREEGYEETKLQEH